MALGKRFVFRNFLKKVNVFRNAKAARLKKLREQFLGLKRREEVESKFHQRQLERFYESMQPLIQMGFNRRQIEHMTDVFSTDLSDGRREYGTEARAILESFSLAE